MNRRNFISKITIGFATLACAPFIAKAYDDERLAALLKKGGVIAGHKFHLKENAIHFQKSGTMILGCIIETDGKGLTLSADPGLRGLEFSFNTIS